MNETVATPKEAQMRFCRECVGGQMVADCQGNEIKCAFYPYRKKEGRVPVRAHRQNCLYCMGDSSDRIDACTTEDCASYLYRFGKAPNRAHIRPSQNTLDALANFQRSRVCAGEL